VPKTCATWPGASLTAGCSASRQAERGALIGAISAPGGRVGVPVAVVCGQPGAGKTALALYAAHKLSECFPDGQLWVQLAGASERPRDPGEILGELLRDLGVPGSVIPDEHSERPRALRSALAGRKVLVVADDAASVAQVEPLLPGTSGCALIVSGLSAPIVSRPTRGVRGPGRPVSGGVGGRGCHGRALLPATRPAARLCHTGAGRRPGPPARTSLPARPDELAAAGTAG
jgi:hypothetical protein